MARPVMRLRITLNPWIGTDWATCDLKPEKENRRECHQGRAALQN